MKDPQRFAPSGVGPGAAADARARRVSAFYMLGLLTFINAFNYLDRNLFGLVLPLIKADLEISDTALGLVSGLAFALFYSTMGVPIARLADRGSRRNIIAAGLTVWSAATMLTGVVANVWQLVLTRFLLGAGEASSIAPSNSIAFDLFKKSVRPFAIAVLGSATAISSIALVPIAAWISHNYGWRMTFMAAAVPGLCLALLLVLTTREPARGGMDTEENAAREQPRGFFESVRRLSTSRAFVMILIAECFLAVNVYAINVWFSSFLVRVHEFNMMEVGVALGPLRGAAALIGSLLGGVMVTRLARLDGRWRLWVPAIATCLVLPLQLMLLFTDQVSIALGGFFGVTMMFMMQQPPVFAVALGVAPIAVRATAIAILMLFANLTGQLIGPLTVGYLNDALAAVYAEQAIRYSLSVCAVSAFLAGIALFLGSRDATLRNEVRDAAPDQASRAPSH